MEFIDFTSLSSLEKLIDDLETNGIPDHFDFMGRRISLSKHDIKASGPLEAFGPVAYGSKLPDCIARIFRETEFFLCKSIDSDKDLSSSEARLILSSFACSKSFSGLVFSIEDSGGLLGIKMDCGRLSKKYTLRHDSEEALNIPGEFMQVVNGKLAATRLDLYLKRAISDKNFLNDWLPWTHIDNPISHFKIQFLWPQMKNEANVSFNIDEVQSAPIWLINTVLTKIQDTEFDRLEYCLRSEMSSETVLLKSLKCTDLSIDKRKWIGNSLEKIFLDLDGFLTSLAKFCLLAITPSFMYCDDESSLDLEFLSVFWEHFIEKFTHECSDIKLLPDSKNGTLANIKIVSLLRDYINIRRPDANSATEAENCSAKGRLSRLPNSFLLNASREQLWAPETLDIDNVQLQDPGSREESPVPWQCHQRQLFSDMEAFMAANPGCVFEDFIRWYSPKDWEPDNGLSARMRDESNLWRQLWNAGKPLSAAEQIELLLKKSRGENNLLESLQDIFIKDIAEFCLYFLQDIYKDQLREISKCLQLNTLEPHCISRNYFASLEIPGVSSHLRSRLAEAGENAIIIEPEEYEFFFKRCAGITDIEIERFFLPNSERIYCSSRGSMSSMAEIQILRKL